ncbi:BZ3500_MvSof-1268-A1-R1_Chr3-1g05945 [Microbotryum saponariae]|uniref:BZ3500_MvSof-1268-A1-R1_Chr3-1g05945 protein n=1 Tax=Microbotryum saponariae TaxID=289078 RepID=A0A2X0M7B5_9BASI|nr:BZ3500_MvSof-1268-A1-R1_Chr3-1g05945 [Microbotryum saponariae]SDA05135.1 BZ3501_MvSof-1269-A2-R1_Chr3-1g05615 [Microbotryum saponariae]
MNAPSRYDQFVLADGEPRLVVDEDTKIPNAATVTINKQDHTLANMLRASVQCIQAYTTSQTILTLTASSLIPHRQLLSFSYVTFAGYRVPHPLEPKVVLKIQTDGSASPLEAIGDAVQAIIVILAKMKEQFGQELIKARALGTNDEGDFYGGGMEGVEAQAGFL